MSAQVKKQSNVAASGYPERPRPNLTPIPAVGANVEVANLAALTALPIPTTTFKTGFLVWVDTVKRWYVLDRTNTLTVDGITVVTTSDGGTTRWLTTDFADPTWRVQAAWGIDAGTGNDENVGSVASPLKTWAEFLRRFGDGNVLQQTTTVTLASNLPTSDPIYGKFIVPVDMFLIVQGGVASTLLTGTLTGVTALNRATNTAWTLVDAAQNFTAGVSHRIRNTTVGARLNAISWITRTNVGGAGVTTARVSLPVIMPAVTSGSTQGATSSWVNGDTYAVEQLFTARLGDLEVHPQNGTVTSDFPTLVVSAIDFTGFNAQPLVNILTNFYACRFNVSIILDSGGGPGVTAVACLFNDTIQISGGFVTFTAGAMRGASGTGLAGGCFGGHAELDQDFLVQGSFAVIRGSATMATVGFFDAAAVFPNPLGAGLMIGASPLGVPSVSVNNVIRNTGSVALYGADNVVGIHVAAGCQLRYATLANITVAGPAADAAFRLGIAAATVDVLDAGGAFATIATTYAALAGHAAGNAVNGNNLASIIANV